MQTHNYSWEKWQAEYPDQVNTFFAGMDDVEAWDGKVHSHAMLYANVMQSGANGGIPVQGTSCITCKSTTGTKLYEEMGINAFLQDGDTYIGVDGEKVDWFDCALCHAGGEPGGELKASGMAIVAFGDHLLADVTTSEAVCGQCHNYIGAVYTRGGLMNKMQSGEVDPSSVDPWRYGYDAESLMKAALEDGYVMRVDEATGIATFQANHPEVEVFQGSVHERLGLTCVSCHGVVMTNDEGSEYTTHAFSESPLENETALEYCLTCHKAQGANTADEMIAYVRSAQQEMSDLEDAFKAKQAELRALIADAAAAGVESDALDLAREKYTMGTWFVRYADGGGDFAGMKIAHNPEGEIDHVERAIVLMQEGIDLLTA